MRLLQGDVLYSAGLSQQQRSPTEWPTWVPDWSVPNQTGYRFWCSIAAERGRYKAGKDHKFSARLLEDTGKVIGKGNVIDILKHVGTFNQWATFSNVEEAIKTLKPSSSITFLFLNNSTLLRSSSKPS